MHWDVWNGPSNRQISGYHQFQRTELCGTRKRRRCVSSCKLGSGDIIRCPTCWNLCAHTCRGPFVLIFMHIIVHADRAIKTQCVYKANSGLILVFASGKTDRGLPNHLPFFFTSLGSAQLWAQVPVRWIMMATKGRDDPSVALLLHGLRLIAPNIEGQNH